MNKPSKGSRVLRWSESEHTGGQKVDADLESKAGMCADVGGAIKACTGRDRISNFWVRVSCHLFAGRC